MAEPTLRQRADAAIREVNAIRSGKWPGDEKYKKFGETMLDRYEALARGIKTQLGSEGEEHFYG